MRLYLVVPKTMPIQEVPTEIMAVYYDTRVTILSSFLEAATLAIKTHQKVIELRIEPIEYSQEELIRGIE